MMAATSEESELLELFQLQNNEGPCLDCFRTGVRVLVPDLSAADTRWPAFAATASQVGFRSAHAFPLRLRSANLGALNLFGTTPGGMSELDASAAQALADIATIAILQHRASRDAQALADQLHAALDSRVVIEQAKGVVAERLGVEVSDAFEVLRRHARFSQRPLSELAADIVSGIASLPQLPAEPG